VSSQIQLLATGLGRCRALIEQIDAFAPDNAARLVGIAIIELFTDIVRTRPSADQIFRLINGRRVKAGLELQTWRDWEAGTRRMGRGDWTLFQVRTGLLPIEIIMQEDWGGTTD
jgi:hypothetical protein